MEVLASIIVGLITGWLAVEILPRAMKLDLLLSVFMGIIGGCLAGVVYTSVANTTSDNPLTIMLVAFVGALVLVVLVGFVKARMAQRQQ